MRQRMDKQALFALLIVLSLNHSACALPNDKNQILNVKAGSADINQQTHQGVFLNQVELDQGTTHIRAASAITTGNKKNQLVLAVIKGNHEAQAHYWTDTAPNKPPLHAYADTINYYPERHVIELIGHARVEQARNSFSAPKITYDTEAQHIISEAKPEGRTTIIFYPEKLT